MITSPQKPIPRKGLLEKQKKKKRKQKTGSHSVFKSAENKFSCFWTLFFPANSNKMKMKKALLKLLKICIVQTHHPRWDQSMSPYDTSLSSWLEYRMTKPKTKLHNLTKTNTVFKNDGQKQPVLSLSLDVREKSTTAWTPKWASPIIHALVLCLNWETWRQMTGNVQ